MTTESTEQFNFSLPLRNNNSTTTAKPVIFLLFSKSIFSTDDAVPPVANKSSTIQNLLKFCIAFFCKHKVFEPYSNL